MTENEKLRALLAEARAITQDSLDSNTTGFDEEFKVCRCDSCERYRSIIQRIDAALAEPVERLNPYSAAVAKMRGDAWQKQAMQRERERNEARAEADKLRETLLSKHGGEPLALLRELDEARAEAMAAYRRGAEAMREAAAKEVFSFYAWSKDNEATRTDIKNLAELIDALPVPEDKP